MTTLTLSGGPFGGELVETHVAPGEVFEIDGARYRRVWMEAVYVGMAK